MKIAGIDFPEEILDALRDGNLVVFAGAGVSKAAGLPDFKELSEQIAEGSGKKQEDGETEHEFLDRLKSCKVNVHNRAAKILDSQNKLPAELHKNLLRLFSDVESVRIVTTNYDRLFEQAAQGIFDSVPSYHVPALPSGHDFNGIVHVHGSVDLSNKMILAGSDLGKGYIDEKHVSDFLLKLFPNFTTLFVGYSHKDTMMNFLIASLSEVEKSFSLMPECEKDKWKRSDIKPIYFPASGQDYSCLGQIIEGLIKRRSLGTRDWQQKIKEIVEKSPSLATDEEIELIVEKLKDVVMVKSFTDSARDPEWIEWLDARKYLDNLFGDRSSEERNDKRDEERNYFSCWLARDFVRDHSDDLFQLIAKHNNKHNKKLHPIFWGWLIFNIASEDQQPLDKKTLSRWVSVLLRTAPEAIAQSRLLDLGRCCDEHKLWGDLLRIFNFLSRNRLNIYESPLWNQIPDVSMPRVEAAVPLISDYHDLKKFWKEYLYPNLDKLAESVLEKHVPRWEEMYSTLCIWGEKDGGWDSLSSHRSAIERHRENENPKPLDVLIDAMRDSLEWLIENKKENAERWCARLAESDSPLLHRLAVHGVSKRKDLSADDKIDWLLKNVKVHKFYIHHEIFRAMQLAYPKASQDRREKVIAEVKQYLSPIREEWHKWKKIFDWFVWLNHAAPDCLLLKQELDNIREKYPEIEASPHLDFTHPRGVQIQMLAPESPRSAEELLSKHASDQIDYLLNYEDERFRYPFSRNGLLQTVIAASKKDFGWGIGLAKVLSEIEEWDTDLWGGLMDAWSEMNLDYASPLLPQAEKAASILWRNLKQGEELQGGNWMTRARNHTAGKITLFWCKVIILWRSKQESAPDGLPENYRKELSNIVQDETVHGRLGRTILAYHLSFFLGVDKAWTKENLVPLFDANNLDEDGRAVWDGFLAGGCITRMVAKELEKYFLKMADHIEDNFTDKTSKIKETFIECYVNMINYFVSNPFPEWILNIFQHEDNSIRYIFADQIWSMLMDLEVDRQKICWEKWLKKYWDDRLDGIPKQLQPEEIGRMVKWLPHLTEVFPEAVKLAEKMPLDSVSLDGWAVHELNESESNLWERYPNDVARLLIHLGKAQSLGPGGSRVSELVEKLFQQDISAELKKGLVELLVKLGFDPPSQ